MIEAAKQGQAVVHYKEATRIGGSPTAIIGR